MIQWPVGARAVQVEKERRVYDGILQVDEHLIKFENVDGSQSQPRRFDIVVQGDTVAALLFDSDRNEVILVKRFRVPTFARGIGDGWLEELPSRKIENQPPDTHVKLGLVEALGYQLTRLTEIAQMFAQPEISLERIIIYYAEVRSTSHTVRNTSTTIDGEAVYVEQLDVDELFKRITTRTIQDSKLAIGAHWLKNRLAQSRIDPTAQVSKTTEYKVRGTDKIIGFKAGSILAVKDVDVWVNPEDTDMMMDRFSGRSVSATIRYHGAEKWESSDRVKTDTIADALRAALRGRKFVKPTEVLDTPAGQLARTHNVKRIFHVAVVPGSIGEKLTARPETLEVCVRKVLEAIERQSGAIIRRSMKYKSVIFPILGTGQGGFFTRDVAPRLVRSAIDFFLENRGARLQRIYFCAYSWGDKDILESSLSQAIELERVQGDQKSVGEK